jgi:protein LTV1
MQHLRPVGVEEEGVESILIEAPARSSKPRKRDVSEPNIGITLKDLPLEALPSTIELKRTHESQQAIPESISGFKPDMDQHLRQVLEALEDDAFVDDSLEDGFFGELIEGGERESDEEVDFEFYEDGVDAEGEARKEASTEDEDASWEERFSHFKRLQISHASDEEDEYEYRTEGGDTLSGLPSISVIGGKGKRRRKGTSDASGYSMSSSSMYRTEALQTLDERFERVSHIFEASRAVNS